MNSRTRYLLPGAMLWMGFCTSQALAQVPSYLLEEAGSPAYRYGLLTAPSEVSFPAESAVKAQLGLVSTIQNQISLSQSHRGPSGVNAWVSGNVTALSMDNYPGFPHDPDTALSGTAGADYTVAPGLIAGFALSGTSQNSSLGDYGNFKLQSTSASLYTAVQQGSVWANAIGTYGHFSCDFNRIVPGAPALLNNNGSTGGDNWSAALQGGYAFQNDSVTHGPVAGFVYQNVSMGGFTETGSSMSLAFGSQTLGSSIGQLGYLAAYDLGKYQPYVEASWNHEFADTARNVTASWGPKAYSMPAVILGKDWGETKGGVKIDVGGGLKLVVEGTADFGQTATTLYGGQIGFNAAF